MKKRSEKSIKELYDLAQKIPNPEACNDDFFAAFFFSRVWNSCSCLINRDLAIGLVFPYFVSSGCFLMMRVVSWGCVAGICGGF